MHNLKHLHKQFSSLPRHIIEIYYCDDKHIFESLSKNLEIHFQRTLFHIYILNLKSLSTSSKINIIIASQLLENVRSIIEKVHYLLMFVKFLNNGSRLRLCGVAEV